MRGEICVKQRDSLSRHRASVSRQQNQCFGGHSTRLTQALHQSHVLLAADAWAHASQLFEHGLLVKQPGARSRVEKRCAAASSGFAQVRLQLPRVVIAFHRAWLLRPEHFSSERLARAHPPRKAKVHMTDQDDVSRAYGASDASRPQV